MRSIKTLISLGLLSLSALAVAGAGTASATELCGATDCSTVYESGQTLESRLLEGTKSEFPTSLGAVTCSESTVKGKTTAKSGTPLTGEVTGLTFGGCEFSGLSCTVSAVHLPYSATIEETGEGDGTLKIKSAGSGDPGMKVVCSIFVNCTGTATEPALEVEGGRAALTTVSAVALQLSGSTCPKTAEWSAEYEALSPQPMFVGNRPTILCKTAPTAGGVCTKGDTYTGKIEGSISAGVAKFEKTATEYVQCTKASLEAEYPNNAIGEIKKVLFEGTGEASCESTLPNKPKVPVTYTVEKGPSWFEWNPMGIWQGVMWFTADLTAIKMQMGIEGVTCKYNVNVKAPQLTSGVVANGGAGPTIVSLTSSFARETVNAKCPTTFLMRVTLALVRGKENVYIAKEEAQ